MEINQGDLESTEFSPHSDSVWIIVRLLPRPATQAMETCAAASLSEAAGEVTRTKGSQGGLHRQRVPSSSLRPHSHSFTHTR